MLVLPQEVEMTWCSLNKNYYIKKGYIFTKHRDKFMVDVLDLPEGSGKSILIYCDYCKKPFYKIYSDYTKWKKKNALDKDCCKKCIGEKIKESNQMIYGVNSTMQVPEHFETHKKAIKEKYDVDNISQLDSVKITKIETSLKHWGVPYVLQNEAIKEKFIETNNKKYGVDYPIQNKEILAKAQQTNLEIYGNICSAQNEDIRKQIIENNLEKFGCESSFGNDDVKNKIKQTILERYGVENYTKTDEYKQKTRKTNLERYGAESPMQNPNIIAKVRKTLFANGTAPCSKQQKYLYNLLGGELNYPIGRSSLDIAFPKEKIYIEYDGGGHDLTIKKGIETQKEFKKRQKRRWYFLNKEGWKQIIIASVKDKIPSDDKLIEIIQYAKSYLNTGHSWIRFNIDNLTVETSQFKEHYDFGELRYIKKEDLENQESKKGSFLFV